MGEGTHWWKIFAPPPLTLKKLHPNVCLSISCVQKYTLKNGCRPLNKSKWIVCQSVSDMCLYIAPMELIKFSATFLIFVEHELSLRRSLLRPNGAMVSRREIQVLISHIHIADIHWHTSPQYSHWPRTPFLTLQSAYEANPHVQNHFSDTSSKKKS